MGQARSKGPSRRVSMLISCEAACKSSEKEDIGSVELVPMENPLVFKAEELKDVADGDVKALMKRILVNYERMRRDNDRMRKDNEMLRKQVVSLDASVVRLASIVEGTCEVSLKKDSEFEPQAQRKAGEVHLPVGWQALETEDGSVYYCGPDGRTTWEPP